jgi:hypothetical protein
VDGVMANVPIWYLVVKDTGIDNPGTFSFNTGLCKRHAEQEKKLKSTIKMWKVREAKFCDICINEREDLDEYDELVTTE